MINQITEQIIPYEKTTYKNYPYFGNDIYFSRPDVSKKLDLRLQTKSKSSLEISHYFFVWRCRSNILKI